MFFWFYGANIDQGSSHQWLISCNPKKVEKKCQDWLTWEGCVHIVTLPPELPINSVCGHEVGDHSRNWILLLNEFAQI
jgi:hypothetical protein